MLLQKKILPFSLIAGQHLGIADSSVSQIGSLLPSRTLGRAKLMCYANTFNGNLIVEEDAVRFDDLGTNIELGYVYNSLMSREASRWKLNVGRHIQHSPFDNTLTLIEADGS